MKQKNQIIGLGASLIGGVVLALLWHQFLDGAKGVQGAMWAITLLCAGGLGFLAWKLPGKSDYEDSFSSGVVWMMVSVLGALGVLGGNAMTLTQGGDAIAGYLGLVAGVAIIVIGINRRSGKVASLLIHSLPCIYLVVKLILEFRQWSIDPTIMDYCFALFASICAMIATCHMGYFVANKGKRRFTTFWCLLGVVMCLCTMGSGDVATALTYGGMGLWLLSNGGQLLEN